MKWISYETCIRRGIIPKHWQWTDVEIQFPDYRYDSKLWLILF
jgi:hypothetical protein